MKIIDWVFVFVLGLYNINKFGNLGIIMFL